MNVEFFILGSLLATSIYRYINTVGVDFKLIVVCIFGCSGILAVIIYKSRKHKELIK